MADAARTAVDELVNAFTSGDDMQARSVPDTIKSTFIDARHTIHKIGDVADSLRPPILEIKDIAHECHAQIPTVVRAIDSFRETNEKIQSLTRTVNGMVKPVFILLIVALLLSIMCMAWFLTRSFSRWWSERSNSSRTNNTSAARVNGGIGGLGGSGYGYSRGGDGDGGGSNHLAAALLSSSSGSQSSSNSVLDMGSK